MLQSYTRGQETTRNESNQALPKVWGLCGQSSRPPPACSQFPRAVGTNYTGYPSWSLLKVPPAGWWWSVWGRNRRNHEPYDRDKGDVLHACLPGLLVHVWALDNAPALSNHRKQTRSVLVHPHIQKTGTKKFNLCWS